MKSLSCKKIIFTGHAVERMFKRGISKSEICMCIENGDIIEEYPDDTPYPSLLLLGFVQERPIHIVLAIDNKNESCVIVTAYEPDIKLWGENLKKGG
ncbi:MAG: DUF4258 domain-containing protein [Desulfamplus sp.]|nr:DUF4258 domain-containing protein [Desulfamplus sp.]